MSENNFIARPALAVYNNGGGDLPSLPYYIAVGAWRDNNASTGAGKAYIYDLSGQNEIILTEAVNTGYGMSVAVGSQKVAVGSWVASVSGGAPAGGAVYLYDLDGTNGITILPSDIATSDYFGYDVAIGDNKLVVGAYWKDNPNVPMGAVYIYDLDGTNEIKLLASDGLYNDRFGWSVAVGGGKVAVGAPGDDVTYTDDGSVYLYDLDGSNEVKITCSDPIAGASYFGENVAIGSNKLAVSATNRDENGIESSGAVYLYDLDGSNEVKITLPSPASYDRAGEGLAIGDNLVFVGAPETDDNGTTSGAVFVYDFSGNLQNTIYPSDAAANQQFGQSVAVANGKLVVGAEAHDELFNESGAAYIFDLDGTNEIKIKASDAAVDSYFGSAVAIGN